MRSYIASSFQMLVLNTLDKVFRVVLVRDFAIAIYKINVLITL